MTIDRAAYRTVFNFHDEAVRALDKYSVDDYWKWFWGKAEQLDTTNDDFTTDMIVTVALDCERKQMQLYDSARPREWHERRRQGRTVQ